MPQTASPFGLKVVKAQGGPITQSSERLILIAPATGTALALPQSSGVATTAQIAAIYAGDPVYYDGNGFIQATTTGSPAGITGSCLGTFQGVEYSDSSGKRTVSNKWTNPGLQPGTEVWFWHTAASTADWIFEIQTNTTIFQDSIGAIFGVAYSGTPNAVTGFSVATLDRSVAASTQGCFQVYGLAYDPTLATTGANNGYAPGTPTAGNNNWGDPFVNVYVKLARSQFTASPPNF